MDRHIVTSLRHLLITLVTLGVILACFLPAQGQQDVIMTLIPHPEETTGISALPDSLVAGVINGHDGALIEIIRVPGQPPRQLKAASAAAAPSATAVIIPEMPAYIWSFGCSPTVGAMMAAWYDNNGYPDLYTGQANGGNAPLNNLGWGTVIIGGNQENLCPLSASMNGLDGRTTRGHVDDYYTEYGSSANDPYLLNYWTEHAPPDCAADFMGTNQSELNNPDGSTIFYYYVDNSPYSGEHSGDGSFGLELFFESTGYQVVRRFNQYISGYNNRSAGFTFDQYKAEIDAGRPVMIQVQGHSMAGYGYDPVGNLVYVRNTWDLSDHTFPWGGSYEGMVHYAVTVFELAPSADSLCSLAVNTASLNFPATPSSLSFQITTGECSTLDWSVSSNASWLSLTPASGKGNASVTVDCQANTGTAVRVATISISGPVNTVTISVAQEGNSQPDIAPVITVTPNVLSGVANFDVVVKIAEVNNVPTSGTITVVIPRDQRWSLNGPFSAAVTSLAGVPLNNGDWSYDSTSAEFHIFRMEAALPARGFSTFGFRALFNPLNSKGVATITSQIMAGSGGESGAGNNSDSERLDYFAL